MDERLMSCGDVVKIALYQGGNKYKIIAYSSGNEVALSTHGDYEEAKQTFLTLMGFIRFTEGKKK